MAMQGHASAVQGARAASTSASYFLRPLVEDVQLSEKDTPGVRITCVELWGMYRPIESHSSPIDHSILLIL